MAGLFGGLFGKRKAPVASPPKFSVEDMAAYDSEKTIALERVLGAMAPVVDHAIIPFYLGGAVDMYLFPNALPGTALVTMELIEPDGGGPQPSHIGTYELIAFTHHEFTQPVSEAFSNIERQMCGIFTALGNYSRHAVLKPGDTIEMPGETPEDTSCLVFDSYESPAADFVIRSKRHGLLLCIEVFRTEMEFAMQNGTAALLQLLRDAGHYPYSDLERAPVA